MQTWLYRHALERGTFDSLLRDYVIGGVTGLLRGFDRLEKRWIAVLSGAPRRVAETRAQVVVTSKAESPAKQGAR
jgi:hypothetical protein